MGSTVADAQALVTALRSAYASTPIKLKIIDLYVVFLLATVLVQVIYMSLVGSFPFNAFLSGILSCIGSAVLAVCLRMQVNKENKEFKNLPPERAFADFVLCDESERWHDFLKSEIRQLECPLKDFINLCVDHVLTISFFLP
ncbi:hypothetical protein CY35_07G040200 [Sphagnum magellanicum]|uniref:Uncharacterized protein n=1 Tax=Sphagnum magellanicum TaxID=128215 RepID=A0ACB8HK85_9BRYO|nr:hypothetical protein CY35_07G040200 [Sphagnum magellanicum]